MKSFLFFCVTASYLFLLTVLTPCLVKAQSASTPDITEPISYIQGMTLGNGFDYYNATVFPLSPLVNRRTLITPYDGQNAGTQVVFINDYQSLEQALEINVNASFDIGLVSGSVKSHFYNKVSFEKNTIYLLVKNVIYNKWDQLEDPVLKQQALNQLTPANGVEAFNRSYGNSFVWRIMSGGAYYGLITIITKSESEKMEINNELSGSYGGVSADIQTKFNRLQNRRGIEIRSEEKIIGGTGLGTVLPNNNTALQVMIGKANSLARQVASSPVPLLAQVQPYSVFPEYADLGSGLPVERQLELLKLNNEYLDYINLRKKLTYIVNNPDFFRFKPNDQNNKLRELQQKLREIEINITKIKSIRVQVTNPNNPYPPASSLYPQTANIFGSNLQLPESYQAMVKHLEDRKTTTKFNIFPLSRLTLGDGEMDGHSPSITINARLVKIPLSLTTKINIEATCKMIEDRPDWTTFEDKITMTWLEEGIDFAKGLVIKSVSPSEGVLNARGPEHQREKVSFNSNNTGLIKIAKCLTDAPGDETGRIGCTDIESNPVKITYMHREDAENQPINYRSATQQTIPLFIKRIKSNLIITQPLKSNLNIKRILPPLNKN